jgi:hypothetical protein
MEGDDPGAAGGARDGDDEDARRVDVRVWIGVALTVLWLGGAAIFIQGSVGWSRFFAQSPGDLGSFFEGVVAPLAFLWLVLGLFLQQSELAANNRAIQRQYALMQRTAEHAEVQTRAIAANELHARQDTFVELSNLVIRQLAVTIGFLWMSSQVAVPDSPFSDDEVDALWSRFATGDPHIFGRRLLTARIGLEPAQQWELFWGTPVRERHSGAYVHAFERLLATARECDPKGMIVDALLGDVTGRLYAALVETRGAGPAQGGSV